MAKLAVFVDDVDPNAPFRVIIYQTGRDSISIDTETWKALALVEKVAKLKFLNETFNPVTRKELKFRYINQGYKLKGEVERRTGRNDFFHFEIFEDKS